jgi:hypothetical protein
MGLDAVLFGDRVARKTQCEQLVRRDLQGDGPDLMAVGSRHLRGDTGGSQDSRWPGTDLYYGDCWFEFAARYEEGVRWSAGPAASTAVTLRQAACCRGTFHYHWSSRDFRLSLQASVEIVPRLGNDPLLPYPLSSTFIPHPTTPRYVLTTSREKHTDGETSTSCAQYCRDVTGPW